LNSSKRQAPNPIPLETIMRIADFRAALRTFLSQSEQASRAAGLTPQRYLLLLSIKGAPDGSERLSFTELAERLKVSKNGVTELVGRAERAGLIRREASTQDGRVVYLRLTREGERRLFSAVHATHEDRRRLAEALHDLVVLYRAMPRA